MGVVEKYIYISSIEVLDQVTVLVGQKSNRKVVPFQCNIGSRSHREERISGNVLTKVKYGERFGYIDGYMMVKSVVGTSNPPL